MIKTYRNIFAIGIICCSASCSKTFFVEPVPFGSGVILKFYDHGGTGRKKVEKCILLVEIINDNNHNVYKSFKSDGDCIMLSEINSNYQYKGLRSEKSVLLRGNSYHAEIIADGNNGRSSSWIQ